MEVILVAHERAAVVFVGYRPTLKRIKAAGFGDRLSEARVVIECLWIAEIAVSFLRTRIC